MSTVYVDLNHTKEVKTLQFYVAIEDVREATEEELKHGHAHPPGQEAH
jgi:FKBP-type peptidyl-prolyl cis-trans isomerase SlyD